MFWGYHGSNYTIQTEVENKTNRVSTISRIYPQDFNHFATSIAMQESIFVFAVSAKPFNTAKEESTTQFPKKYHHYVDVFDKVKAITLFHHRQYDCPIDLKPGKKTLQGLIYNLSPTELNVLRAYVEENLANGFIRQ